MQASVDLRSELVAELPHLRRFARALTGNRTGVDDLVQDCLERALTRLHLYDPERKLRTWLYTILRNLHINTIRKDARRGQHVDLAAVPESDFATDAGYGERLMVMDLTKALEVLPLEQREVLLLVALEDLSYEETADVVGSPIGTVMSRLSRARKRLREVMNAEQPMPQQGEMPGGVK